LRTAALVSLDGSSTYFCQTVSFAIMTTICSRKLLCTKLRFAIGVRPDLGQRQGWPLLHHSNDPVLRQAELLAKLQCSSSFYLTCNHVYLIVMQVLQTKFLNDRGVASVTGTFLFRLGTDHSEICGRFPTSPKHCSCSLTQAPSPMAHPACRMYSRKPPSHDAMRACVQLCT